MVILTEVELRKTLLRLTSEIIEKVKNLEDLLLIGIPTRGIYLADVLEKELLDADVDFIAVSNILEICVPEPVYAV